MSRWNLFNRVLRLPPSQLYLGSLGVAVVLALASLAVGAGWISADISFEFSGGKATKPRDIPLGYVQQLNFGLWNFLFCPVLLAAAGMAASVRARKLIIVTNDAHCVTLSVWAHRKNLSRNTPCCFRT